MLSAYLAPAEEPVLSSKGQGSNLQVIGVDRYLWIGEIDRELCLSPKDITESLGHGT
jgi:hypothetical protein